jgi:hypothetical protein
MGEIEDSILKSAPRELRERFYSAPVAGREEIVAIVAPSDLAEWRALFVTVQELEKHGA